MFDILTAALATFGLTALIANYDGPYDILPRLREVSKAFNCVVCLSVWIGALVAVLAGVGVIGYLAIIGFVILVERLT